MISFFYSDDGNTQRTQHSSSKNEKLIELEKKNAKLQQTVGELKEEIEELNRKFRELNYAKKKVMDQRNYHRKQSLKQKMEIRSLEAKFIKKVIQIQL